VPIFHDLAELMIPSAHDRKLEEIGHKANAVTMQLANLRWCGKADLPRMRSNLRETLIDFADSVMAMASEIHDEKSRGNAPAVSQRTAKRRPRRTKKRI
jgi:hypothetical protein